MDHQKEFKQHLTNLFPKCTTMPKTPKGREECSKCGQEFSLHTTHWTHFMEKHTKKQMVLKKSIAICACLHSTQRKGMLPIAITDVKICADHERRCK